VSIQGARGVLINITGGPSLSLHEVNEAATLIQEEADEDANIIFGAVIDEAMGDEVRVTVIATGVPDVSRSADRRPSYATTKDSGAAGRRVIHMGTIIDDAEGPTWRRGRADTAVVEAPPREGRNGGERLRRRGERGEPPAGGAERSPRQRAEIRGDLRPGMQASGDEDGERSRRRSAIDEAEESFEIPTFLRKQPE
jgi:cell division protein FtsZ